MDESDFQKKQSRRRLECDEEQLKRLLRCAKVHNAREWNEWRDKNPYEEIFLEGANLRNIHFCNVNLEGASLYKTHLEGASLLGANMKGADLDSAHMENAILLKAHLEGADLSNAHLQGAWFQMANVDGSTLLWKCEVNRHRQSADSTKRGTDFREVGLYGARIDPGTKQLLEYNIRRKNWEDWYKEHKRLKWAVQLFWCMSDYGRSTGRIILTFFILAFLFAAIYYICALVCERGIVSSLLEGKEGLVPSWLVPFRVIYFSIVTMTTLGFGDMHANCQSFWGHLLLTVQVILGYVLLGALVTRFAVLFTGGGPAGKFADKKKMGSVSSTE